MEKGYYKDPKTGKITKGSFEDAWKKYMKNIEDDVYDADEMQLDDEDEIFISYDDDGTPLGEADEETDYMKYRKSFDDYLNEPEETTKEEEEDEETNYMIYRKSFK
jgi:hypothetical protein